MSESEPELHCSFCRRPARDVPKLVAGQNGAAICSECLDVCRRIVSDDAAPTSWDEATALSRDRKDEPGV